MNYMYATICTSYLGEMQAILNFLKKCNTYVDICETNFMDKILSNCFSIASLLIIDMT